MPDNTHPDVEVTHISGQGIWLLAHDKERFLSHEEFPWFRECPVGAIMNVHEPSPGHFHWPDIDIDLTEEIIEHPEEYPNKAGNP